MRTWVKRGGEGGRGERGRRGKGKDMKGERGGVDLRRYNKRFKNKTFGGGGL